MYQCLAEGSSRNPRSPGSAVMPEGPWLAAEVGSLGLALNASSGQGSSAFHWLSILVLWKILSSHCSQRV